MFRILLLAILVNLSLPLHPHSDPYFFQGRASFFSIVSESPVSTSGNPAGRYSGGRYHMLAGITNHHGIGAYNTLFLGGSILGDKISSFITVKHTSLRLCDYSRTLLNLGLSLKTSEKLYVGSSIKMVHIQLPENIGGSITAGGSAGVFTAVSKSVFIGIAGSFYRTVKSDSSTKRYYTCLLLDFRYKTGKNTYLMISGETVSDLKPRIIASIVSEIIPGVMIMAGAGSGNEQLFAGISYKTGRIKPCFVSGFNPSTGSSNSLLAEIQSRR